MQNKKTVSRLVYFSLDLMLSILLLFSFDYILYLTMGYNVLNESNFILTVVMMFLLSPVVDKILSIFVKKPS